MAAAIMIMMMEPRLKLITEGRAQSRGCWGGVLRSNLVKIFLLFQGKNRFCSLLEA